MSNIDKEEFKIKLNIIFAISNITILAICAWLAYEFKNLWIMIMPIVFHFNIDDKEE